MRRGQTLSANLGVRLAKALALFVATTCICRRAALPIIDSIFGTLLSFLRNLLKCAPWGFPAQTCLKVSSATRGRGLAATEVRGRNKAHHSKVKGGTTEAFQACRTTLKLPCTYLPEGGNESLCRTLWNRTGVASQILPLVSDSEGRDRHQTAAVSTATLPAGRPGACSGSVPS